MKITNHNCETNEVEIIEASDEQIKQIEKVIKDNERRDKEIEQKKLARNSALSKLIDLGLTEEEIAAL